jgi:hypothetical protein
MNNSHTGGEAPPQLSWEALGAACFWVSIKADGSRACLPSRALLERACSIPAVMLSSLETVRLDRLAISPALFRRHPTTQPVLAILICRFILVIPPGNHSSKPKKKMCAAQRLGNRFVCSSTYCLQLQSCCRFNQTPAHMLHSRSQEGLPAVTHF